MTPCILTSFVDTLNVKSCNCVLKCKNKRDLKNYVFKYLQR